MIELLVGMIGSGKSVYARKMADAHDYVVICHDEISRIVRPGLEYHSSWKGVLHDIEEAMALAAMRRGVGVIIDRTNLEPRSRKRWIQFAREHKKDIEAIVFPFGEPEEHARRRFADDPRGFSLEHWEEIASKQADLIITWPISDREGFTKIKDAPGFQGWAEAWMNVHEAR